MGPGHGRDLADLYHAAYRRLVAQVFAFTTDLSEAQDAVQEAFARALARPHGLAGVDVPEAWLRTVATNVVRRRWRRRQILNTILLRERPLVRGYEDPPEPERADLREALATLPRPYREVIVLHYLADLPVDEVAAILEVPVGTVKSRLSRGREALKGLLDDVEAPPLSQVRQRASRIRTRRQVTKATLALVAASTAGFFLFRPATLVPVVPRPAPSVAPSYFANGIVINGISDIDIVTAPDLPGTIVELTMVSPTEGFLATSPDENGHHRELHTLDGGQTWLDDNVHPGLDQLRVSPGAQAQTTWQAPLATVTAGLDKGVLTIQGVALTGASGDGLTGTIRRGYPSKVVVMTLQGNKITGVYEGQAGSYARMSDGGGMTVSGEPILLPDGRLMVADANHHVRLSSDKGATWTDEFPHLPAIGRLYVTGSGYVALDLFSFGWVALSQDGVTWQKLPIR
jgi:RNA polymerase sigma factor (sigma-70 family)